MAWLESLKSSTAARLVSSAAREIFSESTSEIEDPVADLRNSQSRIAELERLVGDYKSEVNFGKIGGGFLRSDAVVQQSQKSETTLLSELSITRDEAESLRRQLEQCREEKCQEVVALQETNAALVARLKGRICQLEEFCSSRGSDIEKSPPLADTAVQTDTPPVEVMRDFEEAVGGIVDTAALGDGNAFGDVDIGGDDVESVEARFLRIREALASAVELLPPLAPDHAEVVWPPRQPEAQVAVLVAAEAASRQELMAARAYIGQLQRSPSSLPPNTVELHSHGVNTDSIGGTLQRSVESVPTNAVHQQQSLARLVYVCELLETTLVSCAKLLRGECTLAEFDEDISPLIKVGERYADMAETLKSAFASTPLECSLREICSQLETYGKVTAMTNLKSSIVLKLHGLLSKRRDPLRDFLLNGEGKVDEEDQQIVDKFNHLVQKLEYKDALSDAILCLLNDVETGSAGFDSNAYNLDVDGFNIVKRLTAVLFTKSTAACINQTEKGTIEGIRNRIKSIDKTDLDPELKSALSYFDCLFNIIGDSKNDSTKDVSTQAIRQRVSNCAVASDLLKLLALKTGEENELSTVLKVVRLMLHEGKSGSIMEEIKWTNPGLSEEAHAIINCFSQLSKVDAEHELRDCLIELLNFGESNLTTLSPQNQTIVKRVTDVLSHEYQSNSCVIGLLEKIAEGMRNNSLDELDEGIKLMEGDERLLDCLRSLLDSFANLRAKHEQAEKDKVALGQLVRSKHAESQAYHAKLKEVLNERHSTHANQGEDTAKLMTKIERLESHLLQMEESYTRETVAAEEREASLREILGQKEAQLAALQEFVASAGEQIGCALEERNVAREACRTCQAELSAFRLNYTNLQKVLDSFEKERQTETNATTQHFRLENERLQREMASLQQLVKNLQAEVTHLGSLQTINRALEEQLERHDSRLSEAHSLARRYEERIQLLKGKMKEMVDELDGKLDKSVMKSLLISCMKLPPAKRPEAFRSLGSVLNFTPEDYDLLGFNEPVAKNWKDLFWRSNTSTVQNSFKSEHSFIELLANFLEKESTPPGQIRLPTDYLGCNSTGVDTDCRCSQALQGYCGNSASTVQQRQSPMCFTPCEQVAAPKKPNVLKNPLLSGLSTVKPPPPMN
ncbi:Thyroid receptor-interacting protein 11 [Taenia crassiceps]|uniref:Thyroid receptor-interacting protein 11 n=1 Tax=Taenia crassiceps TaxID=6207 RepID=A0ABR4QNP9_9CEST